MVYACYNCSFVLFLLALLLTATYQNQNTFWKMFQSRSTISYISLLRVVTVILVALLALVNLVPRLNIKKQGEGHRDLTADKLIFDTIELLRGVENHATEMRISNENTIIEIKKLIEKQSLLESNKFSGKTKRMEPRKFFDLTLAEAILKFLKQEKVTTLLELGAGTGNYAKLIKNANIQISCYDENPEIQQLTEGRCSMINFSHFIDFGKRDWVMALGVGDNFPKGSGSEKVFLHNLNRGNRHGIILSWSKSEEMYIIEKVNQMGYTSDFETEKTLKHATTLPWFKEHPILVFRRKY